MELAYFGEITTPSRCGRMDQACAYGKTPVFLTFDGDEMEAEELHPKGNIYMVIVDLRAGKNTMKILADLNSCYPRGMGKVGEDVRYYLGPVNAEILAQAKDAVGQGDTQQVGELMTEAQRLFDKFIAPASPSELASPKLHKVLSDPKIQELIWGGKGVGSQGDGCAQFVARGTEEREELKKRLVELDVECFDLDIKAGGEVAVP
jgi:galactokinase